MPPPDAQRAVAARFARAVLHGDAAGARPLLLEANEPAMTFLLRRATVHWRNQRVTIRARPRHSGARWLFSYTSMRSFEDGRFEREDGGLVIVLAPSPSGARVRYFTFVDVRARYSTHHDGQLLPSKR